MHLRRIPFGVLFVGLVVLIADAVTKSMIYHTLPMMDHLYHSYPYGGIGVFSNIFGIEFSIVHAINTGAAWGAFSHYQIPLLVLRLCFIAGLLMYLTFFNKFPSREMPLMLIVAGALGNVVDYFIYGHVIDMLHFVLWGYDFPVFNVADSAITVGIFWLFFQSMLTPEKSPCN